MSSNSSNLVNKVVMCVLLPVWAFAGFMGVQFLVKFLISAVYTLGVPLDKINENLFQLIASAVVYALTLLLVIGGPYLAFKSRTSRKELGIHRFPSWMDIVWVPAGVVGYLILTSIVTTIAMHTLKFVDYTQAQDTGFSGLSSGYEYVLAFLMLVIIAPIAEELIFRGYVFGKLRKYAPLWVSILITSLLFGIAHLAWNVGIDVFALSIVLCILRVVSGSLWPSIMLHMLKNSVAFYFLFIDPSVLSTLVR